MNRNFFEHIFNRNQLIKSVTCCLILSCTSFFAQAQHLQYRLETENFVTRGGAYYGFNGGLTVKRIDFTLGSGFHWGNIVKSEFYTPHVTLGTHYLLANSSKLKMGLGLRYIYTWRRHPFNQKASGHSLYYGYKLRYGEKWFLTNQLGLGGMMRSDFPSKSVVILDVFLSLGFGYAF